jgi:hypothetical protein
MWIQSTPAGSPARILQTHRRRGWIGPSNDLCVMSNPMWNCGQERPRKHQPLALPFPAYSQAIQRDRRACIIVSMAVAILYTSFLQIYIISFYVFFMQ